VLSLSLSPSDHEHKYDALKEENRRLREIVKELQLKSAPSSCPPLPIETLLTASWETTLPSLDLVLDNIEIGSISTNAGADVSTVSTVSTVIPRRKTGVKGPPADLKSPVIITLEILQQLASFSLAKAASCLGISSTALKKASRKLGVTRWPHVSLNESLSGGSGASSSVLVSCCSPSGNEFSVSPMSPSSPGVTAKFERCFSDPCTSGAKEPIPRQLAVAEQVLSNNQLFEQLFTTPLPPPRNHATPMSIAQLGDSFKTTFRAWDGFMQNKESPHHLDTPINMSMEWDTPRQGSLSSSRGSLSRSSSLGCFQEYVSWNDGASFDPLADLQSGRGAPFWSLSL
jgi:hypothetical protein